MTLEDEDGNEVTFEVKKRPAGQSYAPCGVRCLNLCGRGAGQQMQIAEI